MVLCMDPRRRTGGEWRIAQVIQSLPNNQYDVRFEGARSNTTVRSDQLIPVSGSDLERTDRIGRRGVRFYYDISQQLFNKVNAQGLIPVRHCEECRKFFRDFQGHFRYVHNREIPEFGREWEWPELGKYSGTTRQQFRSPVQKRRRSPIPDPEPEPEPELEPDRKRRKTIIKVEDDVDDEDEVVDVEFFDNTLNKGFREDYDDDPGGAAGGIANMPLIRVKDRSVLERHF